MKNCLSKNYKFISDPNVDLFNSRPNGKLGITITGVNAISFIVFPSNQADNKRVISSMKDDSAFPVGSINTFFL